MSLECRILRRMTDGKIQYYYRNTGVRPPAIEMFDNLETAPKYIRDYFDGVTTQDIGPDTAYILGIQDKLYPNFPNCSHPGYLEKRCIAEKCNYAPDGDWEKCPYFKEL